MPIRINLLAEAQAAEEMRRRDPVKRAAWIGGFVVALTLIVVLTLQIKIGAVRSDTAGLERSWKTIEGKVKEVETHRRAAHELELKLSAINQFTTNRMLWANFLNVLQETTVDNVQVVHVKTEHTYSMNEVTKTRPVATATERITALVEGRDYSARQGEQVLKYKDALSKSPPLEPLLQKTNKVELISQTAPILEGSRAYVGFGLQLNFQEKERRLYE